MPPAVAPDHAHTICVDDTEVILEQPETEEVPAKFVPVMVKVPLVEQLTNIVLVVPLSHAVLCSCEMVGDEA